MWCCPSVVEHGRVVFRFGGGQAWILEFLKLGFRRGEMFCLRGEDL